MSDWRKWLDELENGFLEPDEIADRLETVVKGYRLLAEAVEANEAVQDVRRSSVPITIEALEDLEAEAHKAYEKALAHLRGDRK